MGAGVPSLDDVIRFHQEVRGDKAKGLYSGAPSKRVRCLCSKMKLEGYAMMVALNGI